MSNEIIRGILSQYDSETPGTIANLYRILMHGKLAGTGKMIILPVDQGFEHGPGRSFSPNYYAYDPLYHFELAIKTGLSAYAAPLGMLEVGARAFAGQIPLILKVNSGVSAYLDEPNQALTSCVDDALRLGCTAIGFTIYPGSDNLYKMLEQLRELIKVAKANGLVVIVWSYPRGKAIAKDKETALDIISYGAHIGCLMGAHIVKVKLPCNKIAMKENMPAYEGKDFSKLSTRVAHVVHSCFNAKRLVVFSGGAAKSSSEVLDDMNAINEGGGNGSIIGRNSFQKNNDEAANMLQDAINIFKN